LVGNDNILVYRNAGEAADILEKGRGIVFIGFKECPWCQQYAVYLHDERVNALKKRLREGINILNQIIANSCNKC